MTMFVILVLERHMTLQSVYDVAKWVKRQKGKERMLTPLK